MNSRYSSNHQSSNHATRGLFAAGASDRETLSEEAFHRMISIERRRTARSRKLFLLMLLDMGEPIAAKNHQLSLRKVLSTLSRMLRETDFARQRDLMRQFEKRVLDTETHEIFLLWRYRIVPYRSYVKGFKISPSHYVNQDLATIWLDK